MSILPDVTTMSTVELQSHVDRCDRLLAQPALLSRLPDKGEKFKVRRECYKSELERRAAQPVPPPPTAKERNEAEKLEEESMSYEEAARRIGEKYQNRRVPVEETVRRMYEGVLSEHQIQKIIDDVPENFFLTHSETVEMEKKAAVEKRKRELERLRAKLQSAQPPMQQGGGEDV